MNLLRQSIRDSELCAEIPESATTESMFEIYENVLREVANKFAPARTTEVRRQPIAVWFDDESRLLRRQSRMLERRYRRSDLGSAAMDSARENSPQGQPSHGERLLVGPYFGTLGPTS